MTCSVDCVTMRAKILRNFNCTRDRTTLDRKDLSKLAASAWRVAKRAAPEGEGSSARDSKLTKSGGKGSMKASARLAASYEDALGRSIVALQKLSLKHDQEIRELAGAPGGFWLGPKTLQAVKAGMEAGADNTEEAKKRGRGHGLRVPCTHVAATFVEALAVEAEGAPKQVPTTFMALVAARQDSDRAPWSVQGQGGVLSGRNASSSAQSEGDDGVRRARSAQERGSVRGNAGRSGM